MKPECPGTMRAESDCGSGSASPIPSSTILSELKNLERIVLIGSHSSAHFLGPGPLAPLIRSHATDDSPFVVLPHPSPRNFNWFAQNEWFETEIIPAIRRKLTL